MPRIEKRRVKDGSTRYKAIIRRKGYPLKTKTFRTRAQATAWAKRVEVMILDHRALRALPTWEADRRTVADLVDRYVEEILPRKPRSEPEQRYQLQWWRDQIGSYTLCSSNSSPDLAVPREAGERYDAIRIQATGGNRESLHGGSEPRFHRSQQGVGVG